MEPWIIYALLAIILIGFIWYGFQRQPEAIDIALLLDRYGNELAPAYESLADFQVHLAIVQEYYAVKLDDVLVKRGASPPINYKTVVTKWIKRAGSRS